ncbi:MAG: MFS transporter, partial [Gammaproteobacteria bacterium]|nr:MFS transporter [Gammaproteobacteria bacterium]
RAHLMAYKMLDYSPPEDPEKVWINAASGTRLDPFVPNHPDCRLPWGWAWHVAPTLDVVLPGGNEKRVIDPSLSTAPMSKNDWRDLQNITANLTDSVWTQYSPYPTSTATEAQAQADMQYYRNALQVRCLTYGPPPYSCIKNLFFIMDRNTISDDEVEAMLLSGSPAQIQDAFYIVLDGYTPDELGFTSPTMERQPTISISPSVSGMTLTADRIEFEYPSQLNRRQRLTWIYSIDFVDTSAFTASRRTISLQADMDGETGAGTLYLIEQQNPYEIDGPTSWLSIDLRVFQIIDGESRFNETMVTDPNTFITNVISNLNNNTAGQTFESISIDQQTSRLELSQTVDGTAVYNFALAKVRYRSVDTDATDVRVIFRLFPWATSSVEYNQATGYRRYQSGSRVVPLLGKKDNDVTAIPCFASPRINSAVVSMTTQTDAPNVQTILRDATGAEVSQYFGCWLDINQLQNQFPFQFPATNIDGPYTSGRRTIQEHIRSEHQCLVAEIAFLPAPAQNGSTPAQSDKLAQRNLAIVESPNPGIDFSRRIPQTFEIQPALSPAEHDELMIDWGNVPEDSVATIYLPGIDSREMLTLASRKYRHHRLKRIDEHTVRFKTGGISYLPIPFVDGSFPGLLTIDLPKGITKKDVFTVIVRQVTDSRQQQPVRMKVIEKLPSDRHIVGSFQLTIPVRDKTAILPGQQRLLSNLRWIERVIPATNRWAPVFSKYVVHIANRVDGLGGDSLKVAPSPSGQWREAYSTCRLLWLFSTLLIAALIILSSTPSGGTVVWGSIPVAALLAGTVYYWRRKCRPTICQLLRALLTGSVAGTLFLLIIFLFGQPTPNLAAAFIAGVGISATTAITSWLKGCFR